MVCFVHFDFEMCFAPQRRALFRHLNFQKHSETEVFSTFWLGHVLRATTACKFSSLIWPDGSARAALASLLFDNRSHKPLEKHSESWLVYLFAHLHLLSSHSFSSLIFSLLLFSSLTLRTSVFPSVHIVGSLTSKLPSAIQHPLNPRAFHVDTSQSIHQGWTSEGTHLIFVTFRSLKKSQTKTVLNRSK